LNVKQIVVIAIAVAIGIWLYRRSKMTTGKVGTGSTSDKFNGPDVDPQTGAYLPPGALPGTVEFSAQGN
jgi:hypothetical protein